MDSSVVRGFQKLAFLGIGSKDSKLEEQKRLSDIIAKDFVLDVDRDMKKIPGLVVQHGITAGEDPRSKSLVGAHEVLLLKKDPSDPKYLKTVHAASDYGGKVSKSIRYPNMARGFTTVLKKPEEGGVPELVGSGEKEFVPKIDWTYLKPEEQGAGLSKKYFQAVEGAARRRGYPGIIVEATNGGVGYWGKKDFGLKLTDDSKKMMSMLWDRYRKDPEKSMRFARKVSPYVKNRKPSKSLPETLNLDDPSSLPRDFTDFAGAAMRAMMTDPKLKDTGALVRYYKKFDEKESSR